MKNIQILGLSAFALLCLTPMMAQAEHKMIQGRTGLPLVREGGGNVWMENGVVRMNVSGNSLSVTQDYKLHYPGPPLEKGAQQITIAVREDFFRSIDNDAPKVAKGQARGFSAFDVMVDGRRVRTVTEPWALNDKADTATRFRTWTVNFRPGQVRRLRIVSRAPLGTIENRKYAEFRTKDLADWRGAPKRLEIRFSAPGKTESRLSGLEPKPTNVNVNAANWVYTNERPRRDIYAQMPVGYGRTTSRR